MSNHWIQQRGNVTNIMIPNREGNVSATFLLTADRHWDHPCSDWDLQIKHLREAKKRGALVIDIGDFFCAMQGKFDPRKMTTECRPEHRVNDYFDSLVKTAADFFEPYAKLFVRMGYGNHETSILKHNEIDLLRRFVDEIKHRTKHEIHLDGYCGWVRFQFVGFERYLKGGAINLYFHHGAGTGGGATKGIGKTIQRAAFQPDADVVASGHIHQEWMTSITRRRLTDTCELYEDEQVHICCPTYKREGGKVMGWCIEREMSPNPIGAVWLHFKWDEISRQIVVTTERAK